MNQNERASRRAFRPVVDPCEGRLLLSVPALRIKLADDTVVKWSVVGPVDRPTEVILDEVPARDTGPVLTVQVVDRHPFLLVQNKGGHQTDTPIHFNQRVTLLLNFRQVGQLLAIWRSVGSPRR